MGIKKFTDFESRAQLLSGDYIVGYKEDGSAEYKVPISQLLTRSNLNQTSFGTGSAINDLSYAANQETIAAGFGSHAEGGYTYTQGDYAHTEGQSTSAYGDASHAEGYGTVALGSYSHAEGYGTLAFGSFSHAQGRFCEAIGNRSYASGDRAAALHNRSWIWSVPSSDATVITELSTTRAGQFMVNAPGGVYLRQPRVGIGTDSVDYALTVNGEISATDFIYASKSIIPNLPVPRIILKGDNDVIGSTTIQYLSTDGFLFGTKGNITFTRAPFLTVTDFTAEQLANYQIFIEMVMFKKRKNSTWNDIKTQGKSTYVVVPGDASQPWGDFWQRSGTNQMNKDPNALFYRYNHLGPILDLPLNTTIPLSFCLNAHFIEKQIPYLDPTSVNESDRKYISCIVPFGTNRSMGVPPSKRQFGYSRGYKSLYVAFRYICWLPENNNGKGQIVSGPLSPTIRVANTYYAFNKNLTQSALKGFAVVDINSSFQKDLFTCTFV